jgi:ribosomal protein L16/L10AE
MKIKRYFRRVLFKIKLRKKLNNSYEKFVISRKGLLIERNCIDASKIVLSREFQQKKKYSKHKRFQYLAKILKKKKKKIFYSFLLIKRIKTKTIKNYKYRLSYYLKKNTNKKRMIFKLKFNLPITKKGTRSRMGKGKGDIKKYVAKVYINKLIYKLFRISILTKSLLYKKLSTKLGNLKIKII